MASHDFPFSLWLEKLRDSKDNIATQIAEAGRDFFLEEFDAQSWDGNKWEEVKRNLPGNEGMKYAGLPILVNTGSLRQGVVDCIKEKRWNNIHWQVDVDYAKYHNDGDNKLGIQRQFIGDSYELKKRCEKILEENIIKIIKND